MSEATSTVSVRLRFDTAAGARDIDQATAAVGRLGRAEQELARDAARATQELGRHTRALSEQRRLADARPGQDRYRPLSRGEIAAELARISTVPLSELPGRVQAQLRGPDLYQKLAAEQAGRRQVRGEFEQYMASRGLTPQGDRLPVQRGPIGRGLDAAGGRLGLSGGVAGRLGPYAMLAAPAVLGKMALDQTVQARQIDGTPFIGPGAAREAKLRGLPLGAGRLYGYYDDAREALSGDLSARRASEERRARDDFRQPREADVRLRQDAARAEYGQAKGEAGAMAGLRLDRVTPGLDRGSVRGQQEYDLQLRLLPAKQALTLASARQAAAERDVASAVREQAARQRELADAKAKWEEADRQRQAAAGRPNTVADIKARQREWAGRALGAGTAAGMAGLAAAAYTGVAAPGGFNQARYDNASTVANSAFNSYDEAQKRARQAAEVRAEAEKRLAERTGDATAARAALVRAQYDDATAKAGQAEQGTRTLGGLGRAGRQRALVALRAVQRLGPDGVSPEMLALAESVAPETVGKLKERVGEGAKEAFRRAAPDENTLKPLGEARKQADSFREQATGLEQAGLRERSQGIVDALGELSKKYEGELNFIHQAIKKLVADAERRAGNQR